MSSSHSPQTAKLGTLPPAAEAAPDIPDAPQLGGVGGFGSRLSTAGRELAAEFAISPRSTGLETPTAAEEKALQTTKIPSIAQHSIRSDGLSARKRINDLTNAAISSMNPQSQERVRAYQQQRKAQSQSIVSKASTLVISENSTLAPVDTSARLTAILGDMRVKGRESAAVELAAASPGMSVEALCAFVGSHTPTITDPTVPGGSMQSNSQSRSKTEFEAGRDQAAAGDDLAQAVTERIGADVPGGRRRESSSQPNHSKAVSTSDRADADANSELATAMDDLIRSSHRNAPDGSKHIHRSASAAADTHGDLVAAVDDLIQADRR